MENNVEEILFRCSSLGYIMTEPRTKGEGLLSETAKTHCVDVFVSWKYNRFTEINSKFFEKGNAVEEDSITIVSRLTKTYYEKNVDHLKNDFIKGTPDLYLGPDVYNASLIRDTKSAWDIYTFNRARAKKLDSKYEWQIHGYNWLTGSKVGYIDYCLNNTPWHIVQGELIKESYKHDGDTPNWMELQIIANHTYDRKTFEDYVNLRGCVAVDDYSTAVVHGFVEVPLNERHFSFEINTDITHILKMEQRVKDCREYIKTELVNSQFQKF